MSKIRNVTDMEVLFLLFVVRL